MFTSTEEESPGKIVPAGLHLASFGRRIAGLFIETHENPDKAPSDSATMLPLHDMEPLLEKLLALDRIAKS